MDDPKQKPGEKNKDKWVELEQLCQNWGPSKVLSALDGGLKLYNPHGEEIKRDDEKKSIIFFLPEFSASEFDRIRQRQDFGLYQMDHGRSEGRQVSYELARVNTIEQGAESVYWKEHLAGRCSDYLCSMDDAVRYAKKHSLSRGFENSHREKKKADDKTDIKSLPIVKQLFDSMETGTRGVPGKGAELQAEKLKPAADAGVGPDESVRVPGEVGDRRITVSLFIRLILVLILFVVAELVASLIAWRYGEGGNFFLKWQNAWQYHVIVFGLTTFIYYLIMGRKNIRYLRWRKGEDIDLTK